MYYTSTRNPEIRKSAAQVIAQGISEEGGLFVPETLPNVQKELSRWSQMDYRELAKAVFSLFLDDFSESDISACVGAAYRKEKFGGTEPVKLASLTKAGSPQYLLELWHGPTCAFKDMALQILPYFLTVSLKKTAPNRQAVILTATSGDTGKAALEGFRDVPGTKVLVFYPQDGVSPMQKRQMVTQEGENVFVCAIEGNFDDAQTGVKRIFTDGGMRRSLEERGLQFSSANSINWGRLLPQIVYYFYAYFQLFRTGRIDSLEAPINIAVPTGNFGNILAAYYARQMGLPVNRLICASNENHVLTDFIRTGIYDRRREFYSTTSPSMDILISSNLERLLYAQNGENTNLLSQWMDDLSKEGVYTVDPQTLQRINQLFYGGFCSDEGAARIIKETLEREGYLCDPHTAVAVDVLEQYRKETGDLQTPAIIASTASPFKFVHSVLSALEPISTEDEYENLFRLQSLSGCEIPEQLLALREKPVRFSDTVAKEKVGDYVRGILGISGE